MMGRKSLKEKGREIIKSNQLGTPPLFDVNNYNMSMTKQLNYFAEEIPSKRKFDLAVEYYRALGKDVKGFSEHVYTEFFDSTAVLVSLKQRGIVLSERHEEWLNEKYNNAVAIVKEKLAERAEKATIPKRSKIEQKMLNESNVFDTALKNIDDWEDAILSGRAVDNDLFKDLELNAAQRILITNHLMSLRDKYDSICNSEDPQIIEGYSNVSATRMTKIVFTIDNKLIKALKEKPKQVVAVTTKTPRKAAPPSKLTEKVKFMLEYPSLQLKSIPKEKLIGATEVWLYDTEHRRLIKYRTSGKNTITVTGTTLHNWDNDLSGSKVIRWPETQMRQLDCKSRKKIEELYQSIVGKTKPVVGRISENHIIVAAFTD